MTLCNELAISVTCNIVYVVIAHRVISWTNAHFGGRIMVFTHLNHLVRAISCTGVFLGILLGRQMAPWPGVKGAIS